MDNTLCKQAGERIKEIRKEKRVTREQLAEKTGISSKFIYEIEKGRKRFSAEALCRIAEVLEVSCDYIMLGRIMMNQGETGIAEVIALFDNDQQRKLVPILKSMYELVTLIDNSNVDE